MKALVVALSLALAASPALAKKTASAQTAGSANPLAKPDEPAATPAAETRPEVKPAKAAKGDKKSKKKSDGADIVAGGKHWRIDTGKGAVHVWAPPGYNRETAGTVVYVHGYWTNSDGAWKDHKLAQQFKASHQNALFIVPDAPASNDDGVNWPGLKDLRATVAKQVKLPDGPVIVMGHSGAFRTIMQWVDHKLISQIILLDALYAGQSAFDDFISDGKRADQHKLIVVGAGTAESSEAFTKKYKFGIAREKMPASYGQFTKREKRAKLLYIRSQYEHNAIVTSGKVIPVLLRLTPLKST